MIAIKDYKAIYEYRNRRQDRVDGKRLDDEWKTIKGTHVLVDDFGRISKGPAALKLLDKYERKRKSEATSFELGDASKPRGVDYDYDPADGYQEFIHKNVEKLRPVYEEEGHDGLEEEWFKTRLNSCTKNLRLVSDKEIDKAFDDNIDRGTARSWLIEYNNDVKPKLVAQLTNNPEVHNAALNVMYKNYVTHMKYTEKKEPLSFEEFLVTPVKMYRGGSGKEYKHASAFSSYTFNKKAAEKFKADPSGHSSPDADGVIYEAEIRPIDTYGSLNTSGEYEIFVPRAIAPNKNYDEDPRMDGVTWEWSDPIKWIFEDYDKGLLKKQDDGIIDALDSIIQEAEMVKLFDGGDKESDRLTMDRCIESIQKMVLQLTAKCKVEHDDSVFFEGELNDNIGERNVQYPDVIEEHRRGDAKDDEGKWITTENGHHVHLNEEGEPDKGNPHVVEAMESGPSVGSSAKREFNKKLSDIISSSGTFEEKNKQVGDILNELPKGARIDFPDSWTADDGTRNYALYEGEGMWRFRYGRGKNDTYLMSSEEVGGYMLDENESERANLTKIPGEKKERPKPVGGGKHKHDGSVVGNHVSDFHNDQVSQEDREFLKNAVESGLSFGSRKYDYYDRRKFYDAGKTLADEIKRRHKLRKKDPDDVYDGDEPQVEDIFEALRDIRPFGTPESFDKISYDSCLSEERTKAIIKEATDRFPSAWYEAIEHGDVKIFIHDMSGRANFASGLTYSSYSGGSSAIHLFAKEDPEVLKHLGDKAGEFENKCDVALVNELAHELGHYMEWANPEVQDWARRTLSQRTEKSEEEYLEPGYTTKADKFFTSYMGKQYPYGYTEITSCLMQRLGYLNPFETISGKDFGASSKDPESLKYILGILGGL